MKNILLFILIIIFTPAITANCQTPEFKFISVTDVDNSLYSIDDIESIQFTLKKKVVSKYKAVIFDKLISWIIKDIDKNNYHEYFFIIPDNKNVNHLLPLADVFNEKRAVAPYLVLNEFNETLDSIEISADKLKTGKRRNKDLDDVFSKIVTLSISINLVDETPQSVEKSIIHNTIVFPLSVASEKWIRGVKKLYLYRIINQESK